MQIETRKVEHLHDGNVSWAKSDSKEVTSFSSRNVGITINHLFRMSC